MNPHHFWKVFFLCLCVTVTVYGQHNGHADRLQYWLSLATEYRFNQPDTARYYCLKILTLAKETKRKDMEAEALRLMSITYEAQGDYTEALNHGLRSLAIWRELGDKAKTANTLNSVGIIYDQQANFYEALRYYNEAYDMYTQLGDDEHLAMMDVNLGILFKSQGQYQQVIQHYKNAYAIYQRLNLPAEIAFCEANLGSVYYYTQQYDSCIYYSLKAETALLAQKNMQFMPVAQANAGIGYFAQGKLQEAKTYLLKAVRAHRQYGNKKEISFVLLHLARLYQQQGLDADVYASLKEAKSLALSIKSPQQVMEAAKLLADHYVRKGDYHHAYDEFVHYSTVRDTLFEQKKTREITNHQVRYETARKEQEIVLLTQRNAIQELDIQQRNLYLIIATLLVVGAVLVAWIVYRTKRFKEEKLKKEAFMQAELLRLEGQNALQNDRLRISRDLHDNIGANLTFIHSTVEEIALEDEQWQDIKSLVNDTITELRRTVWLINKPSVRLDEWFVKLRDYYRKIEKVHIDIVEADVDDLVLSSKQATALFRIIQEAVNNGLKYAEATKIIIHIKSDASGFWICIEDDGRGFDMQGVSKGFGLDNMQQNTKDIGGKMMLDSVVGRGTRIVVEVAV